MTKKFKDYLKSKTIIDHEDEHPEGAPEKHPIVPKAVVKEGVIDVRLVKEDLDTSKARQTLSDLNENTIGQNLKKYKVDSIVIGKEDGQRYQVKGFHKRTIIVKHLPTGRTSHLFSHQIEESADASKARQTLSDYIKNKDSNSKPLPNIPTPAERRKQLGLPDPLKKEELEVLRHGLDEGYILKKTHVENEPGEFDSGAKRKYYDIIKDGTKVGELSYGEYFGDLRGICHGKEFPDIGGYGGNDPQTKLNTFMKTKTGIKWASNLHKYNKSKLKENYDLSESKMSQLYTDIEDQLHHHIKKYKERKMDADTLGMHCIKAHKVIAKKHNLEHQHAVKFVNDYVEGELSDHK